MAFQEIISYLNSSEVQGFILPFKIIFIFLSVFFAGAVSYFIYKVPDDFLLKKEKYSDFLSFNNFKEKNNTKLRKDWNKICGFLKNDIEADYKLAIIEAYALFSGLLAARDWTGENLAAQIESTQNDREFMFNRTNLLCLASLREKIVADKNYRLDLKEAKSLFSEIEKDIQKAEK
ncbi:MAG: hypothetical protein PHI77_01245 [Candidatus Pacebacteria bacterium]|nr:hypothetical protein [Candidatus Paceibacterota bacterium]MDD4875014.1 hypothetical protein [Candidatus Paceibacterota bacterium]